MSFTKDLQCLKFWDIKNQKILKLKGRINDIKRFKELFIIKSDVKNNKESD